MRHFEILTESMLDVISLDANNQDELVNDLVEEQNAIIERELKGNCYDTFFVVKFDGKEVLNVMTINDAIQCLALKNGCDIVKFENGNFGFIGYYNNVTFDERNYFEVVRVATKEDIANL